MIIHILLIVTTCLQVSNFIETESKFNKVLYETYKKILLVIIDLINITFEENKFRRNDKLVLIVKINLNFKFPII